MNLKENCLSHAKNFSFSSAHGNSVLTLQTQKTQNQILIEQHQTHQRDQELTKQSYDQSIVKDRSF